MFLLHSLPKGRRVIAWSADPRFSVLPDGSIIGPSGRMLKLQMDRDGYLRFSRRLPDGRRVMTKAHQVVCEVSHGKRPEGAEVAHADGNPANNDPGNLRWVSPNENADDRARHGTTARGERHGRARFTRDDVLSIRDRCGSGESYASVARDLATHRTVVRDIALRRRWGHVE